MQLAKYAVALALAISASSACGMTAQADLEPRCLVSNAGKLPAASGGSAALCAAIEQAATARGLGGAFKVRVAVGPRSLLTADVTLADGRVLPPLQMSQMDRPLGKKAIERFGTAVAEHVAGARR